MAERPTRPTWTTVAALFTTGILLAGGSGCGPGASSDTGSPVSTSRATPALGVVGPAQEAASYPSTAQPAASASVEPPVPDWMQRALKHPDVNVRVNALDTWVQQGRQQGVSPLIAALNDPDERVRARALHLIEQDWAAEQAAGEGR